MTGVILANWLPLVLFAVAAVLALYKRGGTISAVCSMACGAAAVLTALVWGWSLEQVLTGVLVPCAISLVSMAGKGGGQ